MDHERQVVRSDTTSSPPIFFEKGCDLLSFERKHVINESKMEKKQHKTMKNDWKGRNSLGSGEM